MKRFITVFMAALLLLAAIGCAKTYANSTGEKTEFTSETGESETEPAKENAATETEEPKTTEEEPTVNNYPIATITLKDGGMMKFELYPDVAPNTVKNFIALANKGFYDGVIFHRIYAGFMVQAGGYKEDGTPVDPEYSIKGEFKANGVKNDLKHERGVISMARAQDPDSAGAQFFIMHADSDFLDGQYAAFGMLIEGFDTLDAIAATPTTYNPYMNNEKSVPLELVVIDTIRVDTFGTDYGEPEIIR